MANVDFWRTSHHDGKISPDYSEGWGARPPPFSLLPSTKLQCTLLLRGQIHSLYFISTLYVLCAKNIRNLHYHLALLSSPSLNFKNHLNHPPPLPPSKTRRQEPKPVWEGCCQSPALGYRMGSPLILRMRGGGLGVAQAPHAHYTHSAIAAQREKGGEWVEEHRGGGGGC